jgi:hypothetical protein|tara:strand:+ start:481 stop:738 length:258 start_codon:yes stop_codon:yes gene_type:complete
MELSYDKYIIMASNCGLRSDYQEYMVHREALKLVETLASTPKDTFKFNSEVRKKPIKQQEAQKVLDKLALGKYDPNFRKVVNLVK